MFFEFVIRLDFNKEKLKKESTKNRKAIGFRYYGC